MSAPIIVVRETTTRAELAEILTLTDHTTRGELEVAIAALRAKAVRYSLHDRRRADIDDEVDLLVTEWLASEA